MVPMSSAKALSGVPDHKKTVRCVTEKIHVSNELRSGMSFSFVGCEWGEN